MTGFDGIGQGLYRPPQLNLPGGLGPEGQVLGKANEQGPSPFEFALNENQQPQDVERPQLKRRGTLDDESAVGSSLTDAITHVASLQQDSKQKAEALARGENVELHDMFITAGKSEVAFNLMIEIRNKLLEAWQTISRSAV